MNPEHFLTLESDNNQATSVYIWAANGTPVIWGKVGAVSFEIGSLQDTLDLIDLLQEIVKETKQIGAEMENLDLDHLHTEDAFMVDQEGWITMPGGKGKISPAGIVYDDNGEEMYSIYEDVDSGDSDFRMSYFEDLDDYEWI